jgi:hypothetical protein
MSGPVAYPRPLTARERETLVAMVEHGRPDDDAAVAPQRRARWRQRADAGLVYGRCGCGQCPSIDLGDLDGPARDTGSRVVLAAEHGTAIVLLFVDDDRPSYLELFDVGESGRHDQFPDPGGLVF